MTRRYLPVLLLMLVVASAAMAQTSTTGAVVGRVADSSGAVPGVTVELKSPALQGTKVAVTDTNGEFRFSLLPPGTYSLSASLEGYGPLAQNNIGVGLNRTVTLELTMSPATVSDVITVTADAPVVDVTSTQTGANVTAETIQSLPLARDFYAVAQVAPGTSQDASGTTVYGSTGAENQYIIDGLNTTGVELGTAAKTLNFDFIQEVQVIT
ncbi:MAG TPA: carboxypeptidase-like regulatory domain-containing protein, partial [Thermoanaerobaculia bacterium]|nr:carboxypeptidase-like regulatory domain-containing protein [Thermoanaerobaculia bacterium]